MADSPRPQLPALPEVRGRNPTRAAFFAEAACAFEFMALWHALDEAGQSAVRTAIHGAVAESASRALKGGKA